MGGIVTSSCRDYLPLLKSVSKRGDLTLLTELCDHMRSHGIEFDESVYCYILNACINGSNPDQFIRSLNEMLKEVEVLQTEEYIEVLQRFSFLSLFIFTVMSRNPRWVLRECQILSSGVCSVCGSTMSKLTLSVTDKRDIAQKVERLIESSRKSMKLQSIGSKESGPDRLKNFLEFKEFLKKKGPYDILLDGANIAHYKQNFEGGSFDYNQIDMLATYLISQGYKILIVLHEHHFGKDYTTLPEVGCRR